MIGPSNPEFLITAIISEIHSKCCKINGFLNGMKFDTWPHRGDDVVAMERLIF